jgi:hypothetical protein
MFREPLDSMRVVPFDEQVKYLSKANQPLRDIAEIILNTGLRPEESFVFASKISISNRKRFQIQSAKQKPPAEPFH